MRVYYFLVWFNSGVDMASLYRHTIGCALLYVILCAQIDKKGCSHNFLKGGGVCLLIFHTQCIRRTKALGKSPLE